jgi:hypothetical protein
MFGIATVAAATAPALAAVLKNLRLEEVVFFNDFFFFNHYFSYLYLVN